MDTVPKRKTISIKAPAKVNLGLLVKERREDGYHNIETILLSISLFDDISLSLIKKGIKIFSSSKDIPKDEANLAYKAAQIFFSRLSAKQGVRIDIEKRIPIARGLGGGSSDAAAVLLGLNNLFDNPFGLEELSAIALVIGSDVPFFILTGMCYALSRGEVLTPLPLPPFSILLYIPPYAISTSWAYDNLNPPETENLTVQESSLKILKEKLKKGEWRDIDRYLRNSFESLVFPLYPDLRETKKRFSDSGAICAGLSGTGSAIYGIVEDGREEEVIERMGKGIIPLRPVNLGRRLFGRTQDFGSWKEGSNPSAPVRLRRREE